MLSGVAAALRFDVEATRNAFAQALAASGHLSSVYVNYAVQKSAEIDRLRLALLFATHTFDAAAAEGGGRPSVRARTPPSIAGEDRAHGRGGPENWPF